MKRHSAPIPAVVLLICLSAGSAWARLSSKALAGWSRWITNPLPPFDDQYAESHQTNTGTDSAAVSRTDFREENVPPFGMLISWQALQANCHATSAYGILALDTNLNSVLGGYDYADAAATASYRDQFTVTAGDGTAPLELIADIEVIWNSARPAQRPATDSFGDPMPPGIFPGPLTSTWFYCYTNGSTEPVAGRMWRGDQWWYEDPPNPSGLYRFPVSLGSFTGGVPFEAAIMANTGSSGRIHGDYTNSVQLKVTGYRVRNTATGAHVPLTSLVTASGFAPVSSGPPSRLIDMTLQGAVCTVQFETGKLLSHSAVIEASTDLLTWQPVDSQWGVMLLTHQELATGRRYFRGKITANPVSAPGYRWVP